MTDLQIGLIVIGALVLVGVLAYNRVQEGRVAREAARAFGGARGDALLGGADARDDADASQDAVALQETMASADRIPDSRIDYVVELLTTEPVRWGVVLEPWRAIERRYGRRAMVAGSTDGSAWHLPAPGDRGAFKWLRAALQLVSRDGPVSETDLIGFHTSVEGLAATMGAAISAPEMKAAVEAARDLDAFCGETDIQVVLHVVAPARAPLADGELRVIAEAGGLVAEPDDSFALRTSEGQLVYRLSSREGSSGAGGGERAAADGGVSLLLDVPRAPDTHRAFEGMVRMGQQLAAATGGRIVDDNGTALDERALGAIAAQLDATRARMEARGLLPGQALALRLYS